MENFGNDDLKTDGRQSGVAAEVRRGISRLLVEMGYSPLIELILKTGRRVDIAAINDKGEIVVVEVKSSIADFRNDRKWHEYLGFCDLFFFAVPPSFPSKILPDTVGLMVADRYGGEILRESPRAELSPARRKTVLLLFARSAANRVHLSLDSGR